MTSREIREAFLTFFSDKSHQIVPSAPVVIKNDPTLMFTNAGMNQFKDIFLGEGRAPYPRVADTQRCLRVSGKHNDLEEVGIDTYHHTLFEMLGNWSFGDYFKREAIAWSWELLTEVYKLDKDRLYVTIFEGDAADGLPRDEEAYGFWKEMVPEDRILLGNKKDNFWEMGDTGPCGPCSEIHVDCRADNERQEIDGRTLVNADHPQVIEIWNLVFMQFNRQKDGSLKPLPAKHVDTGMGFERLVRVIQGKKSNYDTDVFQPLIGYIAQRANIAYGANEQTDIAMRVLADHIRAISFAIADGQLPSNNKAGYVIRRILRRAVRYAYTFLGFKEPFLHELVPLLANQFAGVFDELNTQQDFVQKVILEEEQSFLRTLVTGVQRFAHYISEGGTGDRIIAGGFAFELYDTYGFPIDLTELLAREKGWNVDMPGFQQALEQQKNRSRAATAIDTGDWVVLRAGESVEFVGYDQLECNTEVLKYRKIAAKGKEQYQLVLSVTPFYPAGGGQVGDTGVLVSTANEQLKVTDTKRENGLIVHYTDRLPAKPDDAFIAKVDAVKRRETEGNHSATHLLHAALKQVLGDHVNQKGSLVNADYLRFDFSHFSKVSEEELQEVERIVNAKIRENIPLQEKRDVPFQEAVASGVTALFGEKYGETVRVITFDDRFSRELCGGTHVRATGAIGFFKIVSESAVAAGVRRLEAITGSKAEAFIYEQASMVNELKVLLNNPKDFVKALGKVIEENSQLRKELERAIAARALALKDELAEKVESVNGINFLAQQIDVANTEAVKTLAFALKERVPDLFMVLASVSNDKPSLTVVVSENLVQERGLNAGKIVRELAPMIQGGGGGQPFYATAGGKDVSGIQQALAKAREFVAL
ncbi:alanine--tRNA ligase [Parapedobacter deserti]|uniref:Alanine--tRNA ligase n=1 Tax=Parapedobacter deserti TaxID=1912957 RepID=A0ABV7JIG3_9SPHI